MAEWKHSSTLSEPQHWLEVNGQVHATAALPPVLDGRQTGPDAVEKTKISCSCWKTNLDSSVIQARAIPAPS
jgi:hypothetical protein